jgi:hypothetical protein
VWKTKQYCKVHQSPESITKIEDTHPGRACSLTDPQWGQSLLESSHEFFFSRFQDFTISSLNFHLWIELRVRKMTGKILDMYKFIYDVEKHLITLCSCALLVDVKKSCIIDKLELWQFLGAAVFENVQFLKQGHNRLPQEINLSFENLSLLI